MMKTFVAATLTALTLSGCSVSKSHTTIHPETEYHMNEETRYFVKLVHKIRLNSNVRYPTTDLKNEINDLAFRSGLIPQCTDKNGCYLVRHGLDGRIRIDNEFIIIDSESQYIKLEDVQQAALIIYG